MVWKKLNSLMKNRLHTSKIKELKIDCIELNCVALAEKFTDYFVELVHSTHREDASKYMLSVHDS